MISELRKSDSPVHFQSFNVSALYLDWMATIFRRSDRMVEILSLCSDRMTEIFSLVLRSNG
jgi:hypothetical protein